MRSHSSEVLDSLRQAVEVAAGAMRNTATELEEIAQLLPTRGNKTRVQQLDQCARRLTTAADCLTAEAAAGDPQTIGLAARILRRSLVGAGTIALAFTTGVGAGVGENAYQRFEASRAEAERCLLAVETEVPSAQAALAMALNEELAEIRNRVDSLLAEPGISRHPAFMNPEYQERASGLGLDADRQDLLRHLTGSLNGLQFVYGYDDEEDENLESVKAEIERLGAQVNVLHTTIQAAE